MSFQGISAMRATAAMLVIAGVTACAARTAPEGAQPAPAGVRAEGDVLTRAQIDELGAARMTELFENTFAGVSVQSARGQPRLLVRGYADPLVVIDGVPQGDPQALWSLDPRHIEQIQILRDAGTVSYGRRGAHGVVVITTRER